MVELELTVAGQDLRRERLVQLDHLEVLERQACLVQHLASGGHDAYPHVRGVDAGGGVGHDPRQRLPPFRGDPGLRHEHHGGCPVGDARRVAGRHGPRLLVEDRFQLAQAFQRRVGPRVFVTVDHRGLPLGTGHLDRRDLLAPALPRRRGFLLAAQGELVLLLSGNGVTRRQVLGRFAHDQAAQGVEEPVPVHAVVQGGVAHPVSGPHAVEQEGRSRHVLLAAG